jgi:hypothetical protein
MTDLFAFAEAKRQRDAGMNIAVDAQDAEVPRWSDIAYAAIERVARRQIHVHVDDVIGENVPRPAHTNAWGAVWTRAIRAGIIQRSNQVRPCRTDPKKHAHQSPVYYSRIYDPRCA